MKRMKNRTEIRGVSLPASFWKRLQERRKTVGVPISAQVKLALEKYFEEVVA